MHLAIRATLLLLAVVPAAAQSLGRFEGDVVVEWLENDSGPDRDMRLTQSFSFVDPRGVDWIVPEGAVVNGASIPRALWTLMGSPFVGNYRRATVVHDHYCTTKSKPWQAVHRMFFDALIASDVRRLRAKVLYAGVLAGGPRWSKVAGAEPGQPKFRTVVPEFSEADLRELEAWVVENDPALTELESHVRSLLLERR